MAGPEATNFRVAPLYCFDDLFVRIDAVGWKSCDPAPPGIGTRLSRPASRTVWTAGKFDRTRSIADAQEFCTNSVRRFGDRRMGAMARVLIVDDDVDAARALSQMLKQCGHDETCVEHSAATAVQVANEYEPDIVFVDIELPDMSGYDVALRLHQHPRLRQMRLIALTDSQEHPRREHARASGFERYLVKPVTARALQEVLDMSSR